MISILIFTLAVAVSFFFFGKKAKEIYRNIRLGQSVDRSDNSGERLKRMLLVAFGQKKMFKRPIPAFLHLCVYAAFLITQIELLEIFIDGFTGSHRILFHSIDVPVFHALYNFTISFIEVLSLLAFVATFIFLWRRNMLKLPRLVKPEMKGWPTLDANTILFVEIYLIVCIFMMNGADVALNPGKYNFAISPIVAGWLSGMSESSLHLIERIGWWGHILGVLSFLAYIPYSKHLHIMLAFPNTYFSNLDPAGKIENMPSITKEIKLMMNPDTAFAAPPEGEAQEIPSFGAKDVNDLSWKSLLDAYTCTECGRCTDACPANQTGKLLSPRKVMMDTRDRLEEVGQNIDANGGDFKPDGKTLLHDYISVEELRACTTCNACVDECPVTISPLDIIVELRRNLIMEESNSPAEWNLMFTNIENNGAPWQFSPEDRENWVSEQA